jgi:hypothetical protein
MTATPAGQAGLQGWRANVADGIAKPLREAHETQRRSDPCRRRSCVLHPGGDLRVRTLSSASAASALTRPAGWNAGLGPDPGRRRKARGSPMFADRDAAVRRGRARRTEPTLLVLPRSSGRGLATSGTCGATSAEGCRAPRVPPSRQQAERVVGALADDAGAEENQPPSTIGVLGCEFDGWAPASWPHG